MGKIYAIGDIHGCLAKLTQLMNRIGIDADKDMIVFIGDYIDRGPDARGVVDFILDLKKTVRNTVCLMGNHEQMFLNYYLEGKDASLYLDNGGVSTLTSYGFSLDKKGKKGNVPDSHIRFFTSLLPYYETEDYIFVHAGLRPGISLKQQILDDLLWLRFEFINSTHDFGKTVVFGHTPLCEPCMEENKIGIDTGSVYGGKLTCIQLPERKLYQV